MINIKITIEGDLPDYEGKIDNFLPIAAQKIRLRMREKLAEGKHGVIYFRGKGSAFTHSHQTSAPGEAPANDTGAFSQSLQILKFSSEAVLATALGYPGLLEEGTSRIAPRPLWQATVTELLPTLESDLLRILQ